MANINSRNAHVEPAPVFEVDPSVQTEGRLIEEEIIEPANLARWILKYSIRLL